jgi:hypothetical protein
MNALALGAIAQGCVVDCELIRGHPLIIVWLGFTGKKAVLRGLAV